MSNNENLIVRDAVVINKNFEGREEKPYNPAGSRNFTIVLNGDDASKLVEAGWNVKIRNNDDGTSVGYLRVAVNYANPKLLPKIVQITYKNGKIKKTVLSESAVKEIDGSEIEDVKVEIRPRVWRDQRTGEVGGIKAYLKTMYYTLVKDAFEDDYDDEDEDIPFDVEEE